ncbi:GumC family protein [Thermodesulfobacteriota bacterium]
MAFSFGEGFHPLDFIKIVRKRIWWSIFIFVCIVGSTAFWTNRQVPVYEAASKIMVGLDIPQILFSDQMASYATLYYESLTFDTQLHTIKSRAVAERVANALGLADRDVDPAGFNANVRMIQGSIDINRIPNTRLFMIKGISSDPEMARDIANTTVKVYIQQSLDRKVNASRKSVQWLTEQLVDIKDRIRRSEEELLSYQEREGIFGLNPGSGGSDLEAQKHIELNNALTSAKLHAIDMKIKIEKMKHLHENKEYIPVLMQIEATQDELLSSLHQQIVQSEIDLSRLLQKYKEMHPSVISLGQEVTFLKEKYNKEMSRVIEAMELDLRNMEARQEVLGEALERSDQVLIEANKKRINYGIILREAESNKEIYNLLIRKLKETDLAGGSAESNIEVVEYAATPGAPIWPNVQKSMLIAVLIGLSLGIGFAFLLEYFDRTLKSAEEIKRYLDLPILAMIPMIRGGEATPRDFYIMMGQDSRSNESEAFRALRTNIKFTLAEEMSKTLLITSSGPKEGKTTIVTNLGITFAMSGQRTVVVDTDFRKPQLHSIFGIDKDKPGMTDYLLGEKTLEEVTYKTQVDKLYAIPCGTIPPNPAELIDSNKMKSTIELLTEKFDFSIYDSPPVGILTDASILSTLLGGVLLILNADRVNKLHAKRATELLRNVRATIHGIVVNKFQLGKSGYYYDYYYYHYSYYGYGYGYGDYGYGAYGDSGKKRRRRKKAELEEKAESGEASP